MSITLTRSPGPSAQEIQQGGIATTQLSDGQFISLRVHIPSGSTLKVWSVGVQNNSNNAPAGVTAEVDDETNAVNLVSENSKRSLGNPLAEVDGPVDVAFRVENDSGGTENVSLTFSLTIE